MKSNYFFSLRIIKWIGHTLELQLFLMLVSLPILIAWGLPLSYMSIISTPLFSPLFALFLFICSLLFFTEFVGIPNAYIALWLNWVSELWLWIIKQSSYAWLVGFVKPPLFILVLPIIATVIIMHSKYYTHQIQRIIALGITLCLFYGLTYMYCHKDNFLHKSTIACNRGSLIVIYDAHKTVLIDPGYLGSKPVSSAWINYTLIPEITKLTGRIVIDAFISMCINQRTLEVTQILLESVPVNHIYIPFYKGKLSKKTGYIFVKCKKKCIEQGGKWTSLDRKTITLTLSPQNTFYCVPTSDYISYQDASYCVLRADGLIDNTPFAIYAAKKSKVST